MKRAAILAVFILLFLIANRGAYEGYFQDDELDNISWTRDSKWEVFAAWLVSPRFDPGNFRPPGHAYYKIMERAAGLDFPPYVAVIHALHFLNVVLVWLLLGRLRLPPLAAGAGALFFGFHMALFDAYWKPMYVFDVLCALFSLAALLAWTHRRWVLSLACFWLAYKSKELAIMLPLALAAYELWLSEETSRRRWLRLTPFFAVSLVFGVQVLLRRPEGGNVYRVAFSLEALSKTAPFYASQLLLIPLAGFALPALAAVRDRRVWFGLAAMFLVLAPLLLLPGRIYAAYLYLPLALLAVALAACAARVPFWAVAAFFLLWLPWNYHLMRLNRRAALTIAHENRAYVGELFRVAATLPTPRFFIMDLAPPAFHLWGIEGALRYFYRAPVRVFGVDQPGLVEASEGQDLALLSWHPAERGFLVVHRPAGQPPASYVRMDRITPVWQLLEGWQSRTGYFRWIGPSARAVLTRPEGARRFELVVNAGPAYIQHARRGEVDVLLDGTLIGRAGFTREGWQTVGFDLAPAPSGPVEITFRARPEIRTEPDSKIVFGVPIGGFGFDMAP